MKREVIILKAEETKKRLIYELNMKYEAPNELLDVKENTSKSFSTQLFGKPKMFEPSNIQNNTTSSNPLNMESIRGIGFKTKENSQLIDAKKSKPKEIYNMKEFIKSNPENMQTFSYDTKVVREQLALVKKKEWQDILFNDVDWFHQINITSGLKKMFKF